MGLCPLLFLSSSKNQSERIPVTPRGTHTRLPEGRREELRPGRMCVCARSEDMERGQDGTKLYVFARGTKCTGTNDENPPHCKDLGDLKPGLKVGCARAY